MVQKRKARKWDATEDQILIESVEKTAGKISEGVKLAASKLNRTPRQCRDRFNYSLFEKVGIGENWTQEEEKLLTAKINDLGYKWNDIAIFFQWTFRNLYKESLE